MLGALEARSAKTGKSPRFYKQAPSTQTARLLTVLVEFDPNANDDFSGFERPAFVGAEECVTEPAGTLLGGPLHNNMPNPAELGRGTDNNTFWVPDFSPSHYNKLIYTTSGLTSGSGPTSPAPTAGPASTCAATPSRTITGIGQLVVDAVDALAASDPDFPWADHDIEDRATPTATATCSSPTGSSTTS